MMRYVHHLGFRTCDTKKIRMTSYACHLGFTSYTKKKNHDDECRAYCHGFNACHTKKKTRMMIATTCRLGLIG
jgi:hypothetical protein